MHAHDFEHTGAHQNGPGAGKPPRPYKQAERDPIDVVAIAARDTCSKNTGQRHDHQAPAALWSVCRVVVLSRLARVIRRFSPIQNFDLPVAPSNGVPAQTAFRIKCIVNGYSQRVQRILSKF